MEIRQKSVKDLTPVEYRACYLANYREAGYMQEEVSRCRKLDLPGIAILLWDGPDDKTGSLIGWALLTPVRLHGLIGGSWYTKKRARYSVQFWVKTQYRRKGHAKTLMAEVKKLDPRPHVFPHDRASGELFSAYDVTVLQHDREFIRKKPRVA